MLARMKNDTFAELAHRASDITIGGVLDGRMTTTRRGKLLQFCWDAEAAFLALTLCSQRVVAEFNEAQTTLQRNGGHPMCMDTESRARLNGRLEALTVMPKSTQQPV